MPQGSAKILMLERRTTHRIAIRYEKLLQTFGFDSSCHVMGHDQLIRQSDRGREAASWAQSVKPQGRVNRARKEDTSCT